MIEFNHMREQNGDIFEYSTLPVISNRNSLILAEAKKTIPLGVEILQDDFQPYTVKLEEGNLKIALLKLYVPQEKELSLKKWIEDFSDKYNLDIVIQRQGHYEGLKNIFAENFNEDKILTDKDRDRLNSIFKKLFRDPPKVSEQHLLQYEYRKSLLPDLTSIPFIAIDDEGTPDPEDAFYVQRNADGDLILIVAIADVSLLYEKAKSDFLKHAVSYGATIYGSKDKFSILGNFEKYGLTMLHQDKDSPAWVFKIKFTKGKLPISEKPFLANVRIHNQITPEAFNSLGDQNVQAKYLSEVAFRLKQQRLNSFDEFADQIISADAVVAEIMIKTKERLAFFLDGKRAQKAVFRVQKKPTKTQTNALIKQFEGFNIDARSSYFKNPILLSALLKDLQDKIFIARSETGEDNGMQNTLNHMIEILLQHSHYDNHSGVHEALGVNKYCDVKGRLASGIVNQLVAYGIVSNKSTFSKVQAKKLARKINNNMNSYAWRIYCLRFFEMLQEKLPLSGTTFTGKIDEIEDNLAFVEIDGFKRWGIISNTDPEKTKVGDDVKIKLIGYQLKSQRFLFEIVREEN